MPDDTDPTPDPDDELDALIAGKRPLPLGLEALPPIPTDEPESSADAPIDQLERTPQVAKIRFPPSYISKIPGAAQDFLGDEAIVAGSPLESQFVGEALGALVAVKVHTDGLEVFAKWQVALDAETWVDVVDSSNPSNRPIIVGDEDEPQTVTKLVTAPEAVRAGNRAARCVLYCAGALPARGAGFDEGSIAYEFRAPLVTSN